MILKETFSINHINEIKENKKVDVNLLERSIYAFGLLEALSKVGMPFIFKGGTCLMLLLENPRRLSTDIDIIVEPGTNVENFIESASVIFPFKKVEKQNCKGKNNIEKVHYKFIYDSPLQNKEFYILLDILFEKNHYQRLTEKPISSEILITDKSDILVKVPTADCILGDKLTAFAPHTIGIRFGEDKNLEIIKQMFDIACLAEISENFEDTISTYYATSSSEIEYRGISITSEYALIDTIESAACIAGRGKYGTEYERYSAVMRNLTNHIYQGKFSGEIAAVLACTVMYMAVCVLKKQPPKKITDYKSYLTENISNSSFSKLSYIRKYDSKAFAYLVETIRLLEN